MLRHKKGQQKNDHSGQQNRRARTALTDFDCAAYTWQGLIRCNRKGLLVAMLHRHLNHERFTLAAIDDVITRGRWDDWAALRQAALADPAVLDKVARVCGAHTADPYAQRHHFWRHYAAEHRALA